MPSITIERALGHTSMGCRRRSAVLSIHSMSPWRPAFRNSARRWPVPASIASGVVTRAVSNPAARASARRRSLRSLIIATADRARRANGRGLRALVRHPWPGPKIAMRVRHNQGGIMGQRGASGAHKPPLCYSLAATPDLLAPITRASIAPPSKELRMSTWHVILLGLLEGLTEFLPVSSTGHLLLAGYFLGFNSPGKTFEVLIQLGSILAILTVYSARLVRLLVDFAADPRTRQFVLAILIAFLPAAVIGAGAHKYIKEYLFESPTLVCITLVAGGIVLLGVDKMRPRSRYHDVMDFPLPLAFVVGLAQCLAMIPGVSRSGASIVGALLLGA